MNLNDNSKELYFQFERLLAAKEMSEDFFMFRGSFLLKERDMFFHAALFFICPYCLLPIKSQFSGKQPGVIKAKHSSNADIDAYMAMSKEELINELIISKANELRAKKGYEVKGVGSSKEYISLNSKNSKS